MTKNPCDIAFIPCAWANIQPLVTHNIVEHGITVDSFWEDHVVGSRHYHMAYQSTPVGYFAIHGGSTITLFWVEPHYAHLAQALFARVKQYENVIDALVATGDEFLLSHCVDAFSRMEKQAYFAIYTEKGPEPARAIPLALRRLDPENASDRELCRLSDGFLDGELESIEKGCNALHLYVAEHQGEVVGFGVIQYGTVHPGIASIGMFVREQFRRQGYAANILQRLKHIVWETGRSAISGCWYYNHNSKKSMESAGAYTKTRLLRFFF